MPHPMWVGEVMAPLRGRRWGSAVAVAVVTGAVVGGLTLLSPLRAQGADTLPGRLGMVTLRCRGNQDLSDVAWLARTVRQGSPAYFVRAALEGRALVSSFGPGPAWLGYPAASRLTPGAVVDDRELRALARGAAASALAVATALLVVGGAAVASLPVAVASALSAAFSFAGAATLGQGLWQQTAALPFLAGAVAAALGAGRAPRLLVVAAGCGSLAAWLRPAGGPLVLGVVACAAIRSVRRERSLPTVALALAVGCLVPLPVMAWHLWYLDTILPVAQWDANQRITEHVFSASPRNLLMGLTGLLVSPGRGILWFAPAVPFVVAASLSWARRREALDLMALGLGIFGQWLLAGAFFKWWGGAGFGPRLLTETVWAAAALAVLLAPSLSRGGRRVLVGASACAVLVGLLGLFRFDIAAVEVELDRVHRPEPYFSLRAGPWTSLHEPTGRAVLDAPSGPFRFCAPGSLERATPADGDAPPRRIE